MNKMNFNMTPRRLIFGILQVAPQESVSIKTLIAVGGLFGFSANTIRVTALRLIRNGAIENGARGQYRIISDASAVTRFITGWRLGESRIIPWDGGWTCCFLPKNQSRQKTKNQKVLSLLGFKEGMPKFWIRPNNLSMGFDDLKMVLFYFGLDKKAELFTAHQFSENITGQWKRLLWPVKEVEKKQNNLAEKLKASGDHIDALSFDDALVETYLLGSEAIHMLLTDPLLPPEIMPNTSRLTLTRSMLEYDALGKEIWRSRFDELNTTPYHMELPAVAV
jgi:phenylacetic acid degradation operon negative regulatory protein